MIHLGDITKIHGHDAPTVDCIIGGSPCQDLSIAGNRAGLQGERSGLFMEQIRIVKEMRERDKSAGRAGQYVRPRYMVWENVPGAFSSHKGNDFAAVLEETVHIVEPEAPPIPVPKKGWPTSGCLMGAEWSLAWRVFDAQFWGVPQRRKRIALVADFGGESAPEILFERKGLSWNPNESRPEGKAAPRFTQDCFSGNTVDRETNQNGTGVRENGSFTVNTVDRHAVAYAIDCRNLKSIKEASGTLQAAVFDARGNGDGKIVPTITGDHENRITDYTAIAIERQTFNEQSFRRYKESDKCSTLKAKTGNIGNGSECLIAEKTSVAVDAYNGAVTGDKTASLTCKNDGSHSGPLVAEKIIRWIVRRLTPLECERLQGFPDDWTNIGEWVDSKGRKHELKDSPRYKALGNSIAIPSWKWVLKRICVQYERDATMASLFDGIGGFPLIWEQLNGKGSCLWASEIEEFPIAVTKIHFPEKAGENNG